MMDMSYVLMLTEVATYAASDLRSTINQERVWTDILVNWYVEETLDL